MKRFLSILVLILISANNCFAGGVSGKVLQLHEAKPGDVGGAIIKIKKWYMASDSTIYKIAIVDLNNDGNKEVIVHMSDSGCQRKHNKTCNMFIMKLKGTGNKHWDSISGSIKAKSIKLLNTATQGWRDLMFDDKLYTYSQHGSYLGSYSESTKRGRLINKKEPMSTPPNRVSSIKIFKDQCLKGDMSGCYQVGRAYWNGNGVTENLNLAKKFFDLACDGGYYRSCGKLSSIYLGEKMFIKKPKLTKVKYFAKLACEHEVGIGCDILDHMYKEGKGVEKNTLLSKEYFSKAIEYFYRSCDQNINNNLCKNRVCEDIGFDCGQIAWHNVHDKRMKTDFDKAMQYYKRGCRLGDVVSCQSLGYYYQYGEGIKPNLKKAAKYYDKACTLKDRISCFTLGMWYQFGEKDVILKDLTKAKEYYQKSCELGNKNGCDSVKKLPIEKFCEGLTNNQCYKKCADYYESGEKKNLYIVKRIFKEGCKNNNKNVCFGLGLMFLRGKGVTADHKIALKYFKKSCKLGFGDACSNVAWIYMHGTRVKHNIKEALKYQKRGCYELKSGVSCYILGNSYLKGRGVKRNRKKAKELYKKSCRFGYKDACKMQE